MDLKNIFYIVLLQLVISCSYAPSDKRLKLFPDRSSTVALTSNFSNSNNKAGEVFDFFDVSVRTHKGSPESTPATFGRRAKVNTVRMLGGWSSKTISADTYKWDGKTFVYDFKQATNRIDSWLKKDWDIFQIVLDNPPWAFQRGLKFVSTPNGNDYLKKDSNSVYGNGLPPADAQAWNRYIQAFIRHLVDTYGEDKVLTWRFRVGSEIDTRPQHWVGTRQDFFDHYSNTVTALHAILPKAKVGAHFREASFIGNYVDYTGTKEDSYAPHFITWAKENHIPYDFLAISYYPHIDKPYELDMEAVYLHDISPIQQHPDWNTSASVEIHEYKFIIKMKRAGFDSVRTSHASSFFAMMSKMMLEKNIMKVFQWGTASNGTYNPEALTQKALYPMIGNHLYSNKVIGNTLGRNNLIDGIFTKHPIEHAYDVMLFSFNRHDLTYQKPEKYYMALTVDMPKGTAFEYRLGSIDQNNYADYLFTVDYPKALISLDDGGWRKPNSHVAHSMINTLNEEGKSLYRISQPNYIKSNGMIWSEWKTSKTINGNHHTSQIQINNEIPSFAVQKYEIRFPNANWY